MLAQLIVNYFCLTYPQGKIFVDASGITKIGEFGLAALCSKFAGSLPGVSMEGLSRWMSPELLDPHQEDVAATVMSDIWALGCTVFEVSKGCW